MLEETESSASPGTPVTKRIAGPGIWPKVKVYLAFSALAIFFAESVGGNYPSALLNPLVYIAYGFPFILLLDDLVRNGENRFYPWYFSGWLVGWVTEAYVAKVVFYGWPGDHEQIFGFAVGPILVVIFFYDAWITLLLTAYVARRYLGFPFQIQINRGRDRIALTTALVLSVISTHISISQGKPLPRTMIELALSFLILVVIINGLKKVGRIDDFRLSKDERTRILKWGVVIYVLFFLGGATEPLLRDN